MNIRKVTGIFIAVVLVIIGAYDVYAFASGGTEATVSWTIFKWGHEYPAFTFFLGFVMGHFFWQMKGLEKLGWKKEIKDK